MMPVIKHELRERVEKSRRPCIALAVQFVPKTAANADPAAKPVHAISARLAFDKFYASSRRSDENTSVCPLRQDRWSLWPISTAHAIPKRST